MRIPIEALHMVEFASTDEKRPNLGWVELKYDQGEFSMSATNGYCLGQYRWADTEAEDLKFIPGKAVYIRAEDVRIAIKAIPKTVRRAGVDLELVKGKVIFTGYMTALTADKIEASFPNLEAVVPQRAAKESAMPVGFDVVLLGKIIKWCKATKPFPQDKNRGVMTFHFDGGESPVLIEKQLDNGKALFVVMPCRI